MNYFTEKRTCPAAGKCGACQTLNLTYERELSLKMKREITLLGKFCHVEEILPMTPPVHYRNKVQYLLQYNGGRTRFGLYRSSDGGIVSLPEGGCLAEDPTASAVCKSAKKLIDKHKLTIYDGRRGLVRHIMARRGFATGEVLCAIVTSAEGKGERLHESVRGKLRELAEELHTRHPEVVTVTKVVNDTDTALFLGNEEETLFGPGTITDRLCGCEFLISARSFYQINPTQTEVLYRTAAEFAEIQPGSRILDAYCGIGTVGITAARLAMASDVELVGFDVNEGAVLDAGRNAAANEVNGDFYCADDAKFAGRNPGNFNVIFADPPRAGCERRFLDFVIRQAPERFVYISCNPETLARDLGYLRKAYRAVKIQPVDLFPGTAHVETVCLLSKLHADQHIEVELNLDEMDLTTAESKATYDEIKEYVLENTGLKVSQLYIAQIKRKYGIIERANYNLPKSENAKVPNCPPNKEEAIVEALKHFGMIK